MNFNATLIGQSIAFIVFVIFVMKFVWPLLLRQMQEREARIAGGLAAAEQGHKDLAEAREKSAAEIGQGREQAATLIARAQRRGAEIVEEAKVAARTEARRIKESALGEIEQEKEKARQELKNQVAALAISGAEQILMREVDREAHNELLAQVSRQL